MLTRDNWIEVVAYPLGLLLAIVLLVGTLAHIGGCGGIDEDTGNYIDNPWSNEGEDTGGGDAGCPVCEQPVQSEDPGVIDRLRDRLRSLEEQLRLAQEQNGACDGQWHQCIDDVTECAAGQERLREELAGVGSALASCTAELGACAEDLAGCEEDVAGLSECCRADECPPICAEVYEGQIEDLQDQLDFCKCQRRHPFCWRSKCSLGG